MKAIQITKNGGAEVLQYKEVQTPVPTEGQVLIKVHAAPVNFIDTILREGNMPPGMMPELPFIPGVEGTGIIEDANGTHLQKGDKVAFLGVIGSSVYAEYALVDANKLVVLNEDANLQEAAVLPVNYFTAYHMLKNVAKVEAGKTALIYAASGGVGTALIQIAKLLDLKIVALERRDEKVENALQMGADFAFNTSNENWMEQVKKAVGENGINYVFNPVAGDSIKNDLELIAPLGHIVVFGFLGGMGEFNLLQELMNNFSKAPSISFSELYATYFNNYPLVDSGLKELYQWLDEGKIKPVYESMPLNEAKAAHEKLEKGLVRGKLILTVD
ncbi:quinone oxidoreductase family protein [Marinifilum caeruleilacunae]|uniref:Zinc-binding alcohol dehydrogenase family protein n=1 Tax=Marinifilum caeruleilacunae TaxID=2499076 RepID=A0ABX1WQS2_9BACT|nr:zinc-binding alcohol dehydrogenase family protein [Marinifilum caeruleilacunae]NOU58294.1 zinc-binding alcohol dehydrogenase family protein [Marinifilum caeruleilacunae]